MKNFIFSLTCLTLLFLGNISCRADDVPLREGDQLTIRLAGVPMEDINQVSGIYTVDGGGNINLPYIGKIHAAGLKQADVQANIEKTYKAGGIYSSPIVTVSVQFDRLVDVDGDVRAPQRVHYTADMTLLSAIAACGGFTDYADKSKVTILRNGAITLYNVKKIEINKAPDPSLQPGDKVSVKRSFW